MNAELLAFAGVMALAQFSPGPDMILLTRISLREGARAGIGAALGIATGLMAHATVAVAGLSLAFERSPVLQEIMRWGAAAYLLWLAWRIGREIFIGLQSGGESQPVAVKSRRPFLRGLFCNLLNPKAAIVLAALSAPFLRGERPDWWPAAIWAIVVCQAAVLWSLWACLLQVPPLRRAYERAARWIDAAFAVMLALLAVKLILG